MISGCDPAGILAMYLALFIFGIGFNALVGWSEARGYTAFFVAQGWA